MRRLACLLVSTVVGAWPVTSARADFLGVEHGLDVYAGQSALGTGFMTWRVYAVFDDPDDVLVGVSGTPTQPMNIHVHNGGTFYQDPLGSDRAPNTLLFPAFPSLEFDSFVTIGEPGPVEDTTILMPWPGFSADSLGGTNIGWQRPVSDPRTWAVNGVDLGLGRYGILIGQFTHDEQFHDDGSGITFEALISYDVIGGGAAGSTFVAERFVVLPGPGVGAMLLLAGLALRRRRMGRLAGAAHHAESRRPSRAPHAQ